jgi:Inner membrane component of T3SS, cytoplasmic domain
VSEDSRRRIVISREELFAPAVDEALELQRAAEQSVRAPAEVPAAKFRLLYAAWFYLAVAGGLGALSAWAVLETQISDGIRFTATIADVDLNAEPSGWRAPVEIRGELRFNGAKAYLLAGKTRIQLAGSSSRLAPEELKAGSVVTVLGERLGDTAMMVLGGVRLEQPGTIAAPVVDLGDLDFRVKLFFFLLFPVVAGMVGLTVGAVEGVVCRNWDRAFRSAVIGFGIGIAGGVISMLGAGFVYGLLGAIGSGADPTASAPAFLFQMFRRGLAWAIAGMAMGLGQGVALKSSKLKFNGFIGGLVGGLLGGLLFDPIGLMFTTRDAIPDAALSRALGLLVIGTVVGLMIGFTDLLTRDAWLKILSGPLRGKEFSFTRTPIRLGSSPKNEVYLFKDSEIAAFHAEIRKLRDAYELVDCHSPGGTWVDGQRVERKRLADGAHIRIGNSEFTFFSREKKA